MPASCYCMTGLDCYINTHRRPKRVAVYLSAALLPRKAVIPPITCPLTDRHNAPAGKEAVQYTYTCGHTHYCGPQATAARLHRAQRILAHLYRVRVIQDFRPGGGGGGGNSDRCFEQAQGLGGGVGGLVFKERNRRIEF